MLLLCLLCCFCAWEYSNPNCFKTFSPLLWGASWRWAFFLRTASPKSSSVELHSNWCVQPCHLVTLSVISAFKMGAKCAIVSLWVRMRPHRLNSLNSWPVVCWASLLHDSLLRPLQPSAPLFNHRPLWELLTLIKAEGEENLSLTWTVDQCGFGGGTGTLWSNATWRSVMGGAYIPRWWPVIGQDHFCLQVIPPMGPQQGLMGMPVWPTCLWLFAALLVEVVCLRLLLVSS